MDVMSDLPSFFRKLMVHCVGHTVVAAHQFGASAADLSLPLGYTCTSLVRCLTTDVGVCVLIKKISH